jgi:transposase
LLVERIEEQHWRVADAAAAAGVSVRTAYKWLRRSARRGAGRAERATLPAAA